MYDPTTEIGQVRLLADDREEDTAIHSNEEIGVFLALGGGVYQAAALALEATAANQVKLLKVVKRLDVEVDGAKVAAELRAQAKNLRAQAKDAENSSGAAFDVAEMAESSFAVQERLFKQWQRGF